MKKLLALFALLFPLTAIPVSAAQASDKTSADNNLEMVLKANRIISRNQSTVNTVKIMSELPESLRTLLAQAAVSAAVIWGDTILEGDYHADEGTDLESVEEVRTSDGHLVGYRLVYSAKAWDTSSGCYDYQNLDTLKDCPVGRIVEIGFVTADLKESLLVKAAQFTL